ncbi:MAG: PEGA domain-containing protein [Ignavibacteriae bacterium]|nr:PEGA domain-containing protein [Ignavibacteriota bacterium]
MKQFVVFGWLFFVLMVQTSAQETSWLSVTNDTGTINVYVDSVLLGETPLDSVSLISGTHVLRFVQPGTRSWYQIPVVETVSVAGGEHLKRTVVQPPSPIYQSRMLIHPLENVNSDSGSIVPRHALANGLPSNNLPLYLTSSAAIVSGAVAAFFKIKADNLYDEFERTGDQSALDKVKTYDTVSGIALGVCEINLGLLTYFLLSK